MTHESLNRIEEQIRRQLTGRVRDLRIVLHRRKLILRGRSHTYYAKQLAQQAVMEAFTLPLEANEIEVL